MTEKINVRTIAGTTARNGFEYQDISTILLSFSTLFNNDNAFLIIELISDAALVFEDINKVVAMQMKSSNWTKNADKMHTSNLSAKDKKSIVDDLSQVPESILSSLYLVTNKQFSVSGEGNFEYPNVKSISNAIKKFKQDSKPYMNPSEYKKAEKCFYLPLIAGENEIDIFVKKWSKIIGKSESNIFELVEKLKSALVAISQFIFENKEEVLGKNLSIFEFKKYAITKKDIDFRLQAQVFTNPYSESKIIDENIMKLGRKLSDDEQRIIRELKGLSTIGVVVHTLSQLSNSEELSVDFRNVLWAIKEEYEK